MTTGKIKNILLIGLALVLAGMTITTCNLQRNLRDSDSRLQFLADHPVCKTETLYLAPEKIEPPKSLGNEVIPKKVILPKVKPEEDTPSFEDSKIIGMDLNFHDLSFTLSNDSLNQVTQYSIKPEEYRYVWVDGKLTAQKLSLAKRLDIRPNISLAWRPIHNLWDLEATVSFKTKSFNYNLGVNGFYYPRFQNHPGIDAIIRITYNF